MDPAEIRRKNFIPKFSGRSRPRWRVSYDSGDYGGALDRLLQMLDYKKFRAEQAEDAAQGPAHRGRASPPTSRRAPSRPSKVVGALGAEAGLYESGKVRVHPTGKVSVFTGSHSHGQGHETTFAQLVAHQLGIPMDDVDIIHGDTGIVAVRHGHLRQPLGRPWAAPPS